MLAGQTGEQNVIPSEQQSRLLFAYHFFEHTRTYIQF